MYILLRFLDFIFGIIPRTAGYFLFEVIGIIKYYFSSKRRKTLEYNLSNAIGKKPGPSLVKSVYKTYARYYFDMYVNKNKLLKSVRTTPEFEKNFEKIKHLPEKYGGLIVYGAHLGNWDLGACFVTSIMFPGHGSLLVEKLSPPVYRWFTEARAKLGINAVPVTDIKTIMKILRQNTALVMASDRDLNKTGYTMDFFGKKAYIPSGPAKLAVKMNIPIVFGGMVRNKDNPMIFNPIIDDVVLNLDNTDTSEEYIEGLAKKFVKRMEVYVSKRPDQWCMLQQVWVDTPEAQSNGTIEK